MALMGYTSPTLMALSASTTILEKNSSSAPMSLLDMQVLAQLIRHSSPRSSTLRVRCSLMYLTASLLASLYPAIIEVGWIFCFTSSSAFFSSSAAMMTTLVVPSPTSSSWSAASSTSTLAAGCSTSSSWRMVAPSLVIVTSPTSSTIILSRPTGPRLLLTMLAMLEAAITFCVLTSCPLFLSPAKVKADPSDDIVYQSEI